MESFTFLVGPSPLASAGSRPWCSSFVVGLSHPHPPNALQRPGHGGQPFSAIQVLLRHGASLSLGSLAHARARYERKPIKPPLRGFITYLSALLIAYALAWCASFAYFFHSRGDAADVGLFFQYFALAWSFRGGEMPAFIWFGSLVAFIPLAVIAILIIRRYARSSNFPNARRCSGSGL